MTKRLIAVILLLVVMILAAGCQEEIQNAQEEIKNVVEQGETPDFLTFDFSSTLICTVDEIIGNQCIAEVTEGNGNYDPETMVLISFEAVTEDADLKAGDVITFTYDYAVDVSAVTKYESKMDTYHNIPHIHTEEISTIPDYVPPETVPETTEE